MVDVRVAGGGSVGVSAVVATPVAVCVGAIVLVGVSVLVGEGDAVGVSVGVAVPVAVAVPVGVSVGVVVKVAVGEGHHWVGVGSRLILSLVEVGVGLLTGVGEGYEAGDGVRVGVNAVGGAGARAKATNPRQ